MSPARRLRLLLFGVLFFTALPVAAQPEPEPKAAAAAAPLEKLPVVVVVPLGKVDPKLVEFVVDSLKRRFYLEVQVHAPIPHPDAAWYAPRKRWRAEKILEALDVLDVGDAWRVTAITEEPISTTKGPVFDWGIAGLGSIAGKSCVFTAYLFRKLKKSEPATYQRYMENLIVHEFGHTLGLDHCPLDRCIMADAKGNAIRAAKASINEFCPRCHRLIQKHLRATEVQGTWSRSERLELDSIP
jgi:archaemetzincin